MAPGFVVTIADPPYATVDYTLDGSDPGASGGAIDPGALGNVGGITVTRNTRIRVRARGN